MNPFQYLAVSFLGGLLLWDLASFWRGRMSRWAWFARSFIWVVAAAAIVYPEAVQEVATAVGITTGANLVLYLFVLAFLATSFYFYSRYVQLQGQITQLVRHIAIQQARRGTDDAGRTIG